MASDMLQSTNSNDYPLQAEDLPPEVLQAMETERQALAAQQSNNRMMQSQLQNPFNMQPYRGMGGFPDIPLQYGGSLTQSLINDDEVPAHIRKKFWNVFHKDNTLCFLDDKRKADKLLAFDIMKIDVLNAIPYYDYDFERELEFGILRNVLDTKLDRSLGLKGGNVKNERIVLQSQFSEQRQISEMSTGNNNAGQGFFKRLLGRK